MKLRYVRDYCQFSNDMDCVKLKQIYVYKVCGHTILKIWLRSDYYYLVSEVKVLYQGMIKPYKICFNTLLLAIKRISFFPRICSIHLKDRSLNSPVDVAKKVEGCEMYERKFVLIRVDWHLTTFCLQDNDLIAYFFSL